VSGIGGMLHRAGGKVEASLLQAMTDFLGYRGADGKQVWVHQEVGLGHALLETRGVGPSVGQQIIELDALTMVADVHLDSRRELLGKLGEAGRTVEAGVSDSALILQAYAVWGPKCVQHLRGDFAFAVWNATARTLFCARDHFGIKPFYYASLGDLFLFSNTLNCLREHPAVSDALNELAIGDFLLFGLNYDQGTTTFRDIQRLPPAHTLLVSEGGIELKRYWSPPTEGRIRYKCDEDYLERFDELLTAAVSDRLPIDRVGILLSGGLDSSAVGAVAKEISDRQGMVPTVSAHTVGYDTQEKDDEGRHAKLVSDYLRIPSDYVSLKHIELFEKCSEAPYRLPEPVDNPLSAGLFEQFSKIAAGCRVVLSGEGSDNLMYFQMWPYLQELWREGSWGRVAVEAAWFGWVRPFPWLGITRRLQAGVRQVTGKREFPEWLAPEFVKHAGLMERWAECNVLALPKQRHRAKPKAHASMFLPQWTHLFELQDPGVTRTLAEVRYPFLDLRLVNFLLAVPAFPWLYKKRLLRQSMTGRLPDEIRLRPKTPLPTDPVLKKLGEARKTEARSSSFGTLSDQILRFVNPAMIDSIRDRMKIELLRAYYLDLWLQGIK
jgi:asparagine synthase (glutamine-hydrolysing)